MKKFESMNGDEIPIESPPKMFTLKSRFTIDGIELEMGEQIWIAPPDASPADGIYTRSNDPHEHSPVIDADPTVEGHINRTMQRDSLDPDQNDFTYHVRAATTSNISLFGRLIVDSVRLQFRDWVLVKNQLDANENGIYEVEEGHWSRLAGFSTPVGCLSSLITVDEGYSQAGRVYLIGASTPDMSEFSSLIFILGQTDEEV